jgi:glycosyltransferase involved in cell wall biosynthesis
VGVADLRVLQFVTTLAFGGAERLATDISIALTRLGVDVVVATETTLTRAFGDELVRAGVPVEHVSLPRTRPLSILRSARELARIVRRHEPHVLHAHNPAAGTVATIARRLARRPSMAIVTTYHGVRPHKLRLASRVLRGGDLVIAVGPGAERQLLAMMPARQVVQIKNAVSVAPSRDREAVRAEFGGSDLPLIVAVGRYVAEKDHALLVDALAELWKGGRRFRALVVGFGPLQQALEARALSHGLEGAVTITGVRSDAVDLIGAADVLAHTSTREGLPLVLLETMARGVPIVAVAATGVSDLIQDGVTGLLVGERSPTAVAAALERVLDDEPLRRRIADGARAYVADHHSFETMVDEHVSVYARAIAMRSRS